MKTAGYVLVYPIVLLLWRIPKLLFKNWALLIVFFPAIESVLFTLKWRFSLGSFAILAALGIYLVDNRPLLVAFMVFLMGYLIAHYILRLRVAFRPTAIFTNAATVMATVWRQSVQTYKRKDYEAHSGSGRQGEAYQKKYLANLKELYLQNLVWEFFAKRLNETVSSRRPDLYFIVAVLYSFVLTVLVFGFEFFALSKIDASSFQNVNHGSLLPFIVFSFNVIMHTNFARIVPVSDSALALANAELIAGVVTLVFFVYVLMTSSRERYRQDFKDLASSLAQSSKEIERFLEKSLRMRLIDAEAKIIEHDPTFPDTMKSLGRTPKILEAEFDPPDTPPEPRINDGEHE